MTVPAAARALRSGLADGWPTADLLRVVREMRANSALVTDAVERARFFAAPDSTGDARWDALLAGAAEDLALRDGFAPPAWSRGHALPEFWWVGAGASLRAYAFARSPISMQVRGVMIDPADLESV